ncbi:MAG TPA: transcription elongation factor GreA [Epulopiscium sp.]|nr:transcription elongation factor GreA [Candidatus Epulonipiscium sp.]
MTHKPILLTYEGVKKLEKELEHLKIFRRIDVAEKLKEARAQGDLSENAEYDAAKEEQAEIETRIAEIEKMFRNVVIIDQDEDTTIDVVKPGCRVLLYDSKYDEEVEYMIVGSTEADPTQGKISNESLVGAALLNHKVGEEITVSTAFGQEKYKILKISI